MRDSRLQAYSIACSAGGDHPTDGNQVEALCIPVPSIKDGYLLLQFCEDHLWDGAIPPGMYTGRLQVGYTN